MASIKIGQYAVILDTERVNRLGLLQTLLKGYEDNKLKEETIDGVKCYTYEYTNITRTQVNTIKRVLRADTGNWVNTEAGNGKSNDRAYVNIPIVDNSRYMCVEYLFKMMCKALFENDETTIRLLAYGKPEWRYYTDTECKEFGYKLSDGMMGPIMTHLTINHINGDTRDNRDENLELVEVAENNKHSYLMSCIAYHFPQLINTEYDCQGHAMHQWKDKVGISCKQIEEYEKLRGIKIPCSKNKKGEFVPKLTYEQTYNLLKHFNKEIKITA